MASWANREDVGNMVCGGAGRLLRAEAEAVIARQLGVIARELGVIAVELGVRARLYALVPWLPPPGAARLACAAAARAGVQLEAAELILTPTPTLTLTLTPTRNPTQARTGTTC